MNAGDARRAALLRSLQRTERARLSDLARELGASIATVRRDAELLHRQGRVDRGHGWVQVVPGGPGRRGRSASEPTIGIVHAANPYLVLIARAVRSEAERRGLTVLVERADRPVELERAVGSLLDRGCSGLIFSPQWPTRAAQSDPARWLNEVEVPVVLAGREVAPSDPLYVLDSVTADHVYGLALALRHLADLGHTRIALSVRDGSPPPKAMRREYPYLIRQLGLERIGPALATPATATEATTARIIDRLRALEATAVIVHTDAFARHLVPALRRHGTAVPAAMSVIGYDDFVPPAADLALTAISPPKHPLGAEALAVVLRRIRLAREGLDRPPVTHVRLLPELVVRTSTGPPPRG